MKGQLNYPPMSKVTDYFISPGNITNNNNYYNTEPKRKTRKILPSPTY